MELSSWYFGVKLAAYTLWMFVGLSLLAPQRGSLVPTAVVLGGLRLLMGLCFGVVIWLAGTLVYAAVGVATYSADASIATIVTYASVYVPVRWVEWAIFELTIDRRARSARGFLAGGSPQGGGWRLGGIAISCLADVPVIVSVGGLPVGRFMC
jgi:hypothetical protein